MYTPRKAMFYLATRSDTGLVRYGWAEDPAQDCERLSKDQAFTVDLKVIFAEPPPHAKATGWYDAAAGDVLWELFWWTGEAADHTDGDSKEESEVDSHEAEPRLEPCDKKDATLVHVVKERLGQERYREVLATAKKSFTTQNGKQVRVLRRDDGEYLRVCP
jgi:hypothetical protein